MTCTHTYTHSIVAVNECHIVGHICIVHRASEGKKEGRGIEGGRMVAFTLLSLQSHEPHSMIPNRGREREREGGREGERGREREGEREREGGERGREGGREREGERGGREREREIRYKAHYAYTNCVHIQ